MAINYNMSYLDQLSAFTKFANQCMEIQDKTAVAQLSGEVSQDGTVQDINKNIGDKPAAFRRSAENKMINNVTRSLFKNTIVNLFGSEKDIPRDVKLAMHMKRFDGSGRPLTARRISAVKLAVMNHFLNTKDNNTAVSRRFVMKILEGEMSVSDALQNAQSSTAQGAGHGHAILSESTYTINENDEPKDNVKETKKNQTKVSTGNDKTTVNNDIISQPEISTGNTNKKTTIKDDDKTIDQSNKEKPKIDNGKKGGIYGNPAYQAIINHGKNSNVKKETTKPIGNIKNTDAYKNANKNQFILHGGVGDYKESINKRFNPNLAIEPVMEKKSEEEILAMKGDINKNIKKGKIKRPVFTEN